MTKANEYLKYAVFGEDDSQIPVNATIGVQANGLVWKEEVVPATKSEVFANNAKIHSAAKVMAIDTMFDYATSMDGNQLYDELYEILRHLFDKKNPPTPAMYDNEAPAKVTEPTLTAAFPAMYKAQRFKGKYFKNFLCFYQSGNLGKDSRNSAKAVMFDILMLFFCGLYKPHDVVAEPAAKKRNVGQTAGGNVDKEREAFCKRQKKRFENIVAWTDNLPLLSEGVEWKGTKSEESSDTPEHVAIDLGDKYHLLTDARERAEYIVGQLLEKTPHYMQNLSEMVSRSVLKFTDKVGPALQDLISTKVVVTVIQSPDIIAFNDAVKKLDELAEKSNISVNQKIRLLNDLFNNSLPDDATLSIAAHDKMMSMMSEEKIMSLSQREFNIVLYNLRMHLADVLLADPVKMTKLFNDAIGWILTHTPLEHPKIPQELPEGITPQRIKVFSYSTWGVSKSIINMIKTAEQIGKIGLNTALKVVVTPVVIGVPAVMAGAAVLGVATVALGTIGSVLSTYILPSPVTMFFDVVSNRSLKKTSLQWILENKAQFKELAKQVVSVCNIHKVPRFKIKIRPDSGLNTLVSENTVMLVEIFIGHVAIGGYLCYAHGLSEMYVELGRAGLLTAESTLIQLKMFNTVTQKTTAAMKFVYEGPTEWLTWLGDWMYPPPPPDPTLLQKLTASVSELFKEPAVPIPSPSTSADIQSYVKYGVSAAITIGGIGYGFMPVAKLELKN
jgi:hypothetical protein